MRTVYKFECSHAGVKHTVAGRITFPSRMFAGQQLVDNQHISAVWLEVELSDEHETTFTLKMYGTGDEIPPTASRVGSFIDRDDFHVWHVYLTEVELISVFATT